MSYVMTNKDRMSINELLQTTNAFQLIGGHEKDDDHHMTFSLTAPGRTRNWYTSNGFSISEAVDNWYERIATKEGTSLRKINNLDHTGLYEAKAAEIIESEAQFYG